MHQRTVFLSIGGNLEDRKANLEETLMFIGFNFGDVVAQSSIYESEPWQMTDVPSFLNQVVKITTELSDEELLLEIHELEEFYGRERSDDTYLSREMDIDVLFIDDLVIQNEKLQIPHARLHLRKFVLVPLEEIASDFIHPELKKTIAELLKDCPDQSSIKKI